MTLHYATAKVIHDPEQARRFGRDDYPGLLLDRLPCDCGDCFMAYIAGWNEAHKKFHERTK